MKAALEKWTRLEKWLLDAPGKNLSKARACVRESLRIVYAVIKDVLSGQITLHAMSLVYTTILSIVPLLALSFSVLKAFNVQDHFTPMLFAFLEPMGEKGLEIHNSILSFVDNLKVGVLGVLGFIFLFYTVVSLIQKIERAFNAIWFAPEQRTVGQRFSNYLIVVLVGPVLVVAALSLTASTMSSSLVQSLMAIEPFGSLILALTKLTPFIMIMALFTLFYYLMPNTKVALKSALVGGIVGGSSWQAVSLLFTSVVVNSAKYDAIYSGFAVGILLLIWLYVNWLILLLGSSIAFYHQHSSHITKYSELEPSVDQIELVGVDMMVRVAKQFDLSDQAVQMIELESRYGIPAVAVRKIIDKLISGGLLVFSGEQGGELVPGKSTDKINLAQILSALHEEGRNNPSSVDESVLQFLSLKRQSLDNEFGQTLLRDLIKEKHSKS